MSAPLQFDADLSRPIVATNPTADVAEQRRVLIDRLALRAGEDVLDIGSGPGWVVDTADSPATAPARFPIVNGSTTDFTHPIAMIIHG